MLSTWRSRIIAESLLLGILIALVGIRVYLPTYIENSLNEKFSDLGEYKGHVEDVDLHLWRAGVTFHNLEVEKKKGQSPAKLLHVETITSTLFWPALLKLKLVAKIDLYKPVINLIDSKDPKNQQSGRFSASDLLDPPAKPDSADQEKLKSWQETFAELYPLKIDRFAIHDGRLVFSNFEADPAVNLYMSDINVQIRNISNSDGKKTDLVSDLELDAKLMGQAKLSLKSEFNALSENTMFDLNARLQKLNLKTLNSFTRHYAKFDFNEGTAEIVSEFAMKQGMVKGYLKPLMHGVDIFDWKQDIKKDNDNPFKAIWESIVGGAVEVAENQRKDQLGTVVPVEVDVSGAKTSVYIIMATTLKNGFVKALIPRFENSIDIDSPSEVNGKSQKKS